MLEPTRATASDWLPICRFCKQAAREADSRRLPLRLVTGIDQVGAPILRPARFITNRASGFFLAETDRIDLAVFGAEHRQVSLDGVSPPLAEGKVVFAAAAVIGIALHSHLGARMLAKVIRMGLE